MELSYCKLLVAVSMSLVTFFFTMLPVLLYRRSGNESSRPRNFRLMSFLSCFGGGVFMATCLLHLFPDVQEQVVLIFKNLNLDLNYPVAEFLLCVGFLIVLITEQIVHRYQENRRPDEVLIAHHHSHGEPHYQNYGSINDQDTEVPSAHQHSHVEQQYQNYGPVIDQNIDQANQGIVFNDDSSHPRMSHHGHSNEEGEPHSHEVSFHQDLSSHSVLSALLLLFALSLHSVFEGLAIGLQSSVESVLKIVFAVLMHKCVIAFTLGLSLTHSRLRRNSAIKGNIFFSLTSPIGILIGLVVVDFVSGLPMLITSGILQGIAAGTFLYVTFFEILPHELNSREDITIKLSCLVLGFLVVSALLIVLPE